MNDDSYYLAFMTYNDEHLSTNLSTAEAFNKYFSTVFFHSMEGDDSIESDLNLFII